MPVAANSPRPPTASRWGSARVPARSVDGVSAACEDQAVKWDPSTAFSCERDTFPIGTWLACEVDAEGHLHELT